MIQIDEMLIRIPGISEDQGSVLGMQVAEKVAAVLPDNFNNKQIPEIRVKLNSFESIDTTFLSDRIADQIVRQIKTALL